MSRSERSRQGGERTAEERERDRQEREARRAKRSGEAPSQPAAPAEGSQPPPVEELQPPAQEMEPAPEAHEQEPAPSDAGGALYTDPPVLEEQPEPHAQLEPQPVLEPVAEPKPLMEEDLVPLVEPEPATDAEPLLDPEPLLGPAPLASPPPPPPPPRASSAIQPPPPLPPELGGTRKAIAARRKRGSSLPARLAAVVALAIVIVAVILLVRSLTHKTHGAATIAPPPVVKVLIPEGKTRMQIAEIAAADHLKGSYRRASEHSPLLDPAQYGAPHGTANLEGFLFPATYDMSSGAPVSRLVQAQLIAFRERFGAHDIVRAKALHVTPYQLLTVASMVEREAQIPSDRPKIASVIYNRLREGMPLGIDASIYYAVELKSGISTYTHELTEAQLHIDSPYNTRTHTGLPPTPISNPGEASIEAAAHPAHDAYLYYVAGADGCGEQVFSNTQAEFEANVAKYEAAKQNNGGHLPACKHH